MKGGPHRASGLEGRSWKLTLAQTLARTRADLSFALVDAMLIVVAYSAALILRFVDLEGVPADWLHGFLVALPIILAVHLAFNVAFGAYGHVWEYASVEEAMRLVAATSVSLAVLLGGLLGYRSLTGGRNGLIPLMVLAVGAGLTLGGMGAVRFRTRLFSFRRHGDGPELERTLVVGTGRVAADLVRHSLHQINVLAFVSHNGEPQSPLRLAGLPVVGRLADVPRLVEWLGISQVLIAAPLGDETLRDLVDGCMDSDVRLRIVPGIDDVLSDGATLRDARDLQIVDLLPRPPVSTDLRPVGAILENKRVLVTGAGGSIGAEIVQQVLEAGPKLVLALDNDETHLFNAGLQWSSDTVKPVLGDIRDLGALRRLVELYRPEVIFHAAAHKQVPLLESFPQEAAKTNVLGTANLLDALAETDVEEFVLISTDKAVDPTSAMGASKRFAELLVQSAASDGRAGMYSAVRFGNVLGSRGSVVPTFMHQIQQGGPVTLSDPEMERYFMTVSEAVQLVLQASAIAAGGEVFVLDMGEPVRIEDLARRMIRLAGLVPGRDIEVQVVGARPGEKIREVLSAHPLEPSGHPKIGVTVPRFPDTETLRSSLRMLGGLIDRDDLRGIRSLLDAMAWQNWDLDVLVDLGAAEEKHEAV
jgi:FlaA1/EpsC-like NDP-sugar epimerase